MAVSRGVILDLQSHSLMGENLGVGGGRGVRGRGGCIRNRSHKRGGRSGGCGREGNCMVNNVLTAPM